MKIKCTKCESIKETGNVEKSAVEMGIAIHCVTCGCAQPHEEAPAEETILDNLNNHVYLHHDEAGIPYPTGCEGCVIGTFHDDERDVVRAVISLDRLQLHFEKEFSEDENPHLAAVEWIDFNVIRSDLGPATPLYIHEVMHHD